MSEQSSGFDLASSAHWIYPSNLPVRDYQYNIVQHALFKNTMVCLPTGLGKTFIAAVVMYNFYRWYPKGKIVFMTPTRPLVAQQIDACYNIMGIPEADMTEMTGTQQPATRAEMWRMKRIFFLTPQVFMNDLGRGVCNRMDIKCLVIDEAHKAQKNHAYCQVVRDLSRVNTNFRILALSATPGNDIKDVQQVINNILISHMEIRSEESIDVQPYTHRKRVEKFVVSLDGNLSSIVEKYLAVAGAYVFRLQQNRALYNQAPAKVTKFMLLRARDKFRQDPPHIPPAFIGRTEGDFHVAITLYHGLELLQLHGPRSLYNHLQGLLHGDKSSPRVRTELLKNSGMMDLFHELATQFDPNAAGQGTAGNGEVVNVHPKMKAACEIVLKHFMDCQAGAEGMPRESKVIIFSQYRDSVDEIKRFLDNHRPLIRPVVFIGHGAASASSTASSGGGRGKKGRGRGKVSEPQCFDENSNMSVESTDLPVPGRVAATKMSQKDQLLIMERFKRGDFNTLVATSIVEEGLDIGEVDLIVCFDSQRSPIRLVQRMGRTGRKRNGRCVMLVTAGKEDANYEESVRKQKALNRVIENARSTLQLYSLNPRMVPENIKPEPLLLELKAPERAAGLVSGSGRGRGRGKGLLAPKRTKSATKLPGIGVAGDGDVLNLPEIIEDDTSESLEAKPCAPLSKADIAEALANELYSQPPKKGKGKPEVITIGDKKERSKKRPIKTKFERSDSSEAGYPKQRKVYEFFAAPRSNAVIDDDEDAVVFVDDKTAASISFPSSVKQRLLAVTALANSDCTATLAFNQRLQEKDETVKRENFDAEVKKESVSSRYFSSAVSWDGFDLDAFVRNLADQLDELDFIKMVQGSTSSFLSPLNSTKPVQPLDRLTFTSSPCRVAASTPKTTFQLPSMKASASKNTPLAPIANTSTSMLSVTQALDFFSPPENRPAVSAGETAAPTTAAKSVINASASTRLVSNSAARTRYISPIIESLAAAFRRKQGQLFPPNLAKDNNTLQSPVNFDIGFDLDISQKESEDDGLSAAVKDIVNNSPVNFDIECDFAIENNCPEPVILSTAFNSILEERDNFGFKKDNSDYLDANVLKTVANSSPVISTASQKKILYDEKTIKEEVFDSDDKDFHQLERNEELLDANLLKALAGSPPTSPFITSIRRDSSEKKAKSPNISLAFAIPARPCLDASTAENSPILRKFRRSGPAKVLDDTIDQNIASSSVPVAKFADDYIYDEDEDDFDDDFKPSKYNKIGPSTSKWVSKAAPPIITVNSAEPSPSPVYAKARRPGHCKPKRKKLAGRAFLNTQAEQSEDEDLSSTDDSENSAYDRDLSGFVDHHLSPPDTQDHAMYLRMQINDNGTPQFRPGRYKLVYQNRPNIYSQTPRGGRRFVDGDDSYVEDSFCVRDDFVEFEESSPSFVAMSPPGRTRRGKKKAAGAVAAPTNRKRMVIISEDEDECEGKKDISAAVGASHSDESNHLEQPNTRGSPLFCQHKSPLPTMPESPQILSQTAKRLKIAGQTPAATSYYDPPRNDEKLVVFVSPRELQAAQNIVSELRSTHAQVVYPIVRSSSTVSVPGLDYVISCRSAVTHVKLSSLLPPSGNVQSRKKFIDEVATLASIVDYPVVIIEEDIKGAVESSKLFISQQLARLLAQASHRRIRTLYALDADAVAQHLVDLTTEEKAAGSAVVIDEQIYQQLLFNDCPATSTGLAARIKFFEAAGQAITPMIALRLSLNFPVLSAFFKQDVDLTVMKLSACARQALTRLRVGNANV